MVVPSLTLTPTRLHLSATKCYQSPKPHVLEAQGGASIKSPPSARGSPSSARANFHTQYSFKEEHIGALFNLLSRYNRLRLSATRCPTEVGRSNHPNYCLFHQITSHLTKNCRILKIALHALIDAGVLRLHPEQEAVALDASTAEDNLNPSSCNVDSALMKDTDSDMPTLTDLDQETIILATQAEFPLVVGTRLGQSYLKEYDNVEISTPQPTQEPVKQPAKPIAEQTKEPLFNKALAKGTSEGSTQPFCFEVLS